MIDQIIAFSIRQKLIIILLIFGLIGWGSYSLKQLPIDAVPDITDNQVQVITNAPTLAAQEVEQLITYPLEMNLGNVPGVVEVRSVSRFGLSVITVVFKEEIDIYFARQLVAERIKSAEDDIPEGLGRPEMSPISTGLGEIYQYVLYAAPAYENSYSTTDLRALQDWVVKRQLVGIEGVIEVNSSGGHLKQYEVAFNPNQLKSMGITLDELYRAIHRNNANAGGSYIEKKHYTYFIRGEGRLKNISEIEQVVIKHKEGLPILVKDVAKVKIGHAPRFGAVTMNGRGEVIASQVMMLKGANAAEVTARVKKRMEQIKKTLPEGIIIEPYLDRSKLVNRTTKTVLTNLIEGGLIVIFVLVLLLGNFRAGLIVASVIPLAMLFAIGMMNQFGVSANLMSLGAIDFGLIVDGAVIIVEAIIHHLGLRKGSAKLTGEEMNTEVLNAATRIRKSAAFGEIIILIVYIPILFLSGIEGKMFKPMAQTVSFAIIGALILSLTYVPMMCALFLKKEIKHKETFSDRLMNLANRLYQPVLDFALKFKWLVIGFTISLFLFSLFVFNRMGGEFLPTLEEGDFALHQILPTGSSIAQGIEVSAELQKILIDNFPEVEKVVTKIGTAEIPTDIMPLEAGDIYVILKPKEEWTSATTKEELFEKMEAKMNEFPGVIYEFTQPIQMRFNELMTGVRQDIAIKIYGEDLGILATKAQEAAHLIEELQGVGDIQVEPTAGLQQMVVDYDQRKMAKFGVNAATINQYIRTGFAGEKVGAIFEGEKRFDLVIRLEENNRRDIDDLKNLSIPIENGAQIPLEELASIGFEEGPSQISRDNTQRRITIGVNTRGRDVESLVKDIQNKLDRELNLPTGYYASYGGAFENLQSARNRLLIAVPIALVLIFVLLYLTFHSFKQTLLIYTAIPMSAIGGIWALYIREMPFSISAGVGFIALFGVAVLNGIVLIAYFNRLKKEGITNIKERIKKGTAVRLRPVLLTAFVASLGFFPMAFSNSAGAEVQQPLATVVIGGLITATFLTLIVLPLLYFFMEKGNQGKVMKVLSIGLGLLFVNQLDAQNTFITLEEALEKARNNYPVLQRQMMEAAQTNKMAEIKSSHPTANLYWSSEEYNFTNNSGVHSLGIQQNFNLPKVNKSNQLLYQEQEKSVNNQVLISETKIDLLLSQAYFELLFQKDKIEEWEKLRQLYEEFVQLSQQRYEAGETSQAPLLFAKSEQRALVFQLQKVQQEATAALYNFNAYLLSDTLFDILKQPLILSDTLIDFDLKQHPLIRYYQQEVEVAKAQLEVRKAQLLPQINTGFQLQNVAGKTLFIGYQLGVNLPLFRKAHRQKVELSRLEIDKNIQQKDLARRRLFQKQKQLKLRKQQISENITMHLNNLIPMARKDADYFLESFKVGESSYLEYHQSIKTLINYRMSYLELLRDKRFITLEIKYLSLKK
jgi:cobalt-zinc-cadmium resistance protein CzcA